MWSLTRGRMSNGRLTPPRFHDAFAEPHVPGVIREALAAIQAHDIGFLGRLARTSDGSDGTSQTPVTASEQQVQKRIDHRRCSTRSL